MRSGYDQVEPRFFDFPHVDRNPVGVSFKMNSRACWVNTALSRYGADHIPDGRFGYLSTNPQELGKKCARCVGGRIRCLPSPSSKSFATLSCRIRFRPEMRQEPLTGLSGPGERAQAKTIPAVTTGMVFEEL